ncbi:DUF6266 family protein [Pedobacter arcticus]|uniref:DUF6266 family protein n=1 Tax=Pedobacter arcticus TaxID=752140 RepID=UPI00031D32C0|nr:DUF6266 family protein [Pedobacter arcticus]
MAKYQFGANGPFVGKLGNVVGCSWKGIPYLRSLPKKRAGKISVAEQANRDKFAIAQTWLKPLTPFLRIGFNAYSEKVEGFIAAKSYLMKNSMEQVATGFYINPEKVLLSYGTLDAPTQANVSVIEEKRLNFTWEPCARNASRAHDQAMLMAYCVEANEACYEIHGAFRCLGKAELVLSPNFKGKVIQVYLAFLAADRNRQSNSLYLGEVMVTG